MPKTRLYIYLMNGGRPCLKAMQTEREKDEDNLSLKNNHVHPCSVVNIYIYICCSDWVATERAESQWSEREEIVLPSLLFWENMGGHTCPISLENVQKYSPP